MGNYIITYECLETHEQLTMPIRAKDIDHAELRFKRVNGNYKIFLDANPA